MDVSKEAESRRLTWKPGVPVVLANGETWQVPRIKAGPIEFIRDGSVEFGIIANGKGAPEVTEAWIWFDKGLAESEKFPHFGHIPNESKNHNLAGVWAAMLRVNYAVSWLEAFWLVRYGFEAKYEMADFVVALRAMNACIDMESLDRMIATFPRAIQDN